MLYLVNLDPAVERRARMTAQLRELGLAWERIGFDGRQLTRRELLASARTRFPTLDFDLDALSGAEIGCWLSHLAAWHALAHGAAPVCTVLEDDLILDSALPRAIDELTRQDRFDLVYLGTSSRNISTRQRERIGGSVVHAPVGTLLNTWGYVIRREFVSAFLSEPHAIDLPIDRYLGKLSRGQRLRVAVIQPQVVREDPELGVRSQIEPFTFRVDRWKAVEAARRWILASRMSDFYYALYRWL